jgi:X-X-X-Leu-X-X-Gly heptad repeat protein
MTQENEAKLVDTIKQLVSKVNQLTDEVNQLKQSQHRQYLKNMDVGLDYTGSRTHTPLQKKVEPQQTEGTYPPIDTAPEWKVEFISETIDMNGKPGAIQTTHSQQAFSEKQAIYLCRKDSYWPQMNGLVKIKEFKSYKEVDVKAVKY